MTGSEPDALTAVADDQVPGADTEGCRFVVASYEAAAPLVSAVTADTARRIVMSPALGDFMDLHFVDLGPRPGPSDDRSAAAQLITEKLLAPGTESGRNYFAIAVADRRAAEVDLVLTECANAPFLIELPLRLHGIASVDDRDSAGKAASRASIAIAPSGAWNHADLVNELRRHANELLRYFAAGRQGLGRGKLDSLRERYKQSVVRERGGQPPENQATAAPELPSPPAQASQPDILAVESAQSSPAQPIQAEPGPAEAVRAEPALSEAAPSEAVQTEPAPVEPVQAEAGPAEPASAQPSPQEPGQPAANPAAPGARLPRWLPGSRRRRGKPAEAGAGAETEAPRIPGLAYLLVIGDEFVGDSGAWQRSRAAMLKVDAKLAKLPRIAYSVRVLQGDAETLRGEQREPGQLSRRDVKHQVADTDFAAVLAAIRDLLRRDLTRLTASGNPLAHPVVMFFTPDPPFADSVIAEAFSQLAQEASIIWVMPYDVTELLDPAFTGQPHVAVLPDHEDVADRIAGLLVPATSAPAVSPGTSDAEAADPPAVSPGTGDAKVADPPAVSAATSDADA